MADIQVACMLLGAVAFVMVLLTLVNWMDDDVRRYAWRIISATMSIFTAVLFFQGNVQLLEVWIEAEAFGAWMQVLLHFAHASVYLVLLGFSIVYITGSADKTDTVDLDKWEWVIGDAMLAGFDDKVDEEEVRAVKNKVKDAKKSVYTDAHGMEVTVHKKQYELDKRQKQMRCWATLLAHMAGFAAIRAGGALQHTGWFESGPAPSFLAMIITGVFLVIAFQLTAMVRGYLATWRGSAAKKGTRKKMTQEEVVESENDVMSLALSFLCVQSVRYAITGTLPLVEGLDAENFHVKFSYCIWLVVVGALFAILSIILIVLIAKKGSTHGHASVPEDESETLVEEEKAPDATERLLLSIMNACAMSFAWCFFWGTKWFWLRLEHHSVVKGETPFVDVHTIFGTVVMALGLSFLTCAVIIVLDKIDDAIKEAAGADSKVGPQAIQSIITSFGILVGFAWEHCFDESVAAVASKSWNPRIAKFLLGVGCVALLVYPWQKYILAKAMQLEELQRLREDCRNKAHK
eukprot:CAMPEP_0195058364 /NCGR_PEP_ID=MMETSP0448-20130528/6253_1 /TAXON_ID=66468 /ORGANISM="Heterocapsa triquestra, Strain CCMP 448" /LENGTH=518 /DNA_ID=CAMNT_0040088513 /DNA_START=12 /DNA_END=1568 /DNA_ORIENTATION=+